MPHSPLSAMAIPRCLSWVTRFKRRPTIKNNSCQYLRKSTKWISMRTAILCVWLVVRTVTKTVRVSPQCELDPRQLTKSPYSCVVLNHHLCLSIEPVSAGKAFDHLGFNPPRKHEAKGLHFYMTSKQGGRDIHFVPITAAAAGAGRLRYHGSTLGRGRRPYLQSYSTGTAALSPGLEQPQCEADHSPNLVPRLRMEL
jgi:hypothetical protein